MAMELKHLNPQHVMDVTGKAIDEISRLRAENAELKAKLEDAKATAYAESVDAGMRERRLKRALYKACVNWAKSEWYTEATWHGDKHRELLWASVHAKCLAKAQEADK